MKPIGWIIKSQEGQRKWDIAAEKWSDDWSLTWTTKDISGRLAEQAHLGSATKPMFQQARRSPMLLAIEARLRQEGDPDRRTSLRLDLWQERRRIQTEKKYAQLSRIFPNLKGGGWGKKSLAPRMQNMTELVTDDNNETIANPKDIASHTAAHYTALLEGTEEVSDHDKPLDMHMQEIMDTDIGGTDLSSCAVLADLVARAVMSCPRR